MKITHIVAAAFVASSMATPAAAVSDANNVLDACASIMTDAPTTYDTPWLERGYCNGIADGVAASLAAQGLICPADEATTGQMVAVITRYAQARPERWHAPMSVFALYALIEAWPCPGVTPVEMPR